jgi:hypothetical protein
LDHRRSGFAESLVSISYFKLKFDLDLLRAWITFHCIIQGILIRLKSEQNMPDAQKQSSRYHRETWDAEMQSSLKEHGRPRPETFQFLGKDCFQAD